MLTFKNNMESHGVFIAEELNEKISSATADKSSLAKKLPKINKIYIGKGVHFYPKVKIGQFIIEENEINIGDTILIKGITTGEKQLLIDEMFVNHIATEKAVAGENITLKLPFRIRLSDKLYKITETLTK